MMDSFGDGWGEKTLLHVGPYNFCGPEPQIPDPHKEVTTFCFPPGTYVPYVCGGDWLSDVRWTIENNFTDSPIR